MNSSEPAASLGSVGGGEQRRRRRQSRQRHGFDGALVPGKTAAEGEEQECVAAAAAAAAGVVLNRRDLLGRHAAQVDELLRRLSPLASTFANGGNGDEALAFLRAEDWDVSAAAARLEATTTWRRARGVHAVLDDATLLREELALRSVLLYDYLGLDRWGRPVMVERVGSWDCAAVVGAAHDLDRFVELHTCALEVLRSMRRPASCLDARGACVIMDMEGLGFSHFSPALLSVFKAINRIDEEHYPDSVAHIFVCNAPYLFNAIFKMVKPFVNPNTLTKVSLSSSVPTDLVEHLGAECLPVELGGARAHLFPYSLEAPPSAHPLPKRLSPSPSSVRQYRTSEDSFQSDLVSDAGKELFYSALSVAPTQSVAEMDFDIA